MSLLSKNSTAAERARGCVFAENFRDASEVVRNSGLIENGAYINSRGANFDGANDKITYPTDNIIMKGQSSISIILEFYPTHEYNYDKTYYLASTDGGYFYILKYGTASSYKIDVKIGSLAAIAITSADFSAFWRAKRKNTISVLSTSESTQIYLNKNLIATSANTGSFTTKPTIMTVGCRAGFTDAQYEGAISKWKIFNKKLSELELFNLLDDAVFSYKGTPLLENNLDLASHDAASLRTLDNTSGERHLIFGDGATSTTFPTKLTHITGYSTDGGDYLVTKNNVVDFFGGEITQVLVFRLGSSMVASGGFLSSYENTTTSNFGAMYYYVAGSGLRFYVGGQGTNFATTPVLKPGNIYTAIGFHDGTNTSLYLDGIKQTDAATPLKPSIGTDMKMHLFVRHGITLFSKTGTQIFYNAFWNKALTPMQLHDLTLTLQRRFKNI